MQARAHVRHATGLMQCCSVLCTLRSEYLARVILSSLLENGVWEDRKMEKIKFPEWGLPGLEIVSGPCGSLLHTWTASQRPYGAFFYFLLLL